METSSALLRTFRGILSVKQSEVRPHLHRTGNLKSRIDRRCATGLAIMALTPRKRTFNSQHGKRLPFTQRQGHNGLDLELQHQNYSVRQEMGYITKTDSHVISCEYTNNWTKRDPNRIDLQDLIPRVTHFVLCC